jgi:molybdopterin/thiamine biosynthesis adenylyltransferase
MMNQRYEGIVDNFNDYTYHILGCGAIGSSAAMQLVRMGADSLKLYDRDIVSEENIGVSQFCGHHVGQAKTHALMSMLYDINTDIQIKCYNGEFSTYYPEDDNIIILGFDSMTSRKEAVEAILALKQPDFLIDGRMGAEHYQQYTFKNPTKTKYLKEWYSDSAGNIEPCNAKATSYCSNMSGSFISNTVRKLVTSQPWHGQISFHFPTMMLEKKRWNP